MKWQMVGVLLLICVGLSGCGQGIVTKDTHGKTVHWAKHPKARFIINVWADWCKPCHDEVPELNALFAKRRENQYFVFGVNFDKVEGELLETLVAKMGMQYPSIYSESLAGIPIPEITALPCTLVFDSKGNRLDMIVGKMTWSQIQSLSAAGRGKK